MEPIGLYIHVPFCLSKCPYCDFYSLPSADGTVLDRYTAALLEAMDRWAERLNGVRADTLYFGGGTPALLGGARLAAVLGRADKRFGLFSGEPPEVTLEANPADDLADTLAAEVVCGDGTEIAMLEEAGIRQADCLIAVTGVDQANLVAAQLAKRRYQVDKVIARVNDPRNMETFRALGVDIPVSSTDTIARLIEQEVDLSQMHLLATLNKGRASISTVNLPKGSALHGKRLAEITWPKGTLIISVVRQDQLIIPNGFTVLQEGAEVAAVSEGRSTRALGKILTQMEKDR